MVLKNWFFLAFATFVSCTSPSTETENIPLIKYYDVRMRHNVARVFYCINHAVKTGDSTFIFPVTEIRETDTSTFRYEFPLDKNRPIYLDKWEAGCSIKLVETREINFNEKVFNIHKYCYSNCESDADTNYFYEPDIGLILIYSINWGNYGRMISHPGFEDVEIFYLGEYILRDREFLAQCD